jgi:hypothetical protein
MACPPRRLASVRARRKATLDAYALTITVTAPEEPPDLCAPALVLSALEKGGLEYSPSRSAP